MKLPETSILPVGVSRTDMYFNETFNQKCRDNFFSQYPEARNKKIVLWAPTFRGKPGVASVYGLDDVLKAQEELKDTHYFIIKLHPHTQVHTEGTNCDIPSEELLPVADIVITDYSSILFDAMIYQLPLVQKEEQLVKVLSDEARLNSSVNQKYHDFFQDYMAACDGHATRRIMDYVSKSPNK